MSGDENEAKGGASAHETTAPEGKPAEALHPVEPPTVAEPDPVVATDWTASDARGPLNEAIRPASSEKAAELAAENPATDAAPFPKPAPEPNRKASRWPVAAGIVVGALIGAGSAYYVYTMMAPDPAIADQKLATLSGRLDSLDKKAGAPADLAAFKASIADLGVKVASADAAARAAAASADAAKTAAAAPPAAGGADLAPLQDKVMALQGKVSDLATAVGGLQQQGRQSAASSDLKAAQDKIAAADAGVATLRAQVSDLQKQAAATQGDVVALRAGQKSLEGKITSAPALAVVADSLIQQIDRGLPFAAQVNALESLGVDPAKIAVLKLSADQGVLSAKVLADKFEPLTDAIVTTAQKPVANASFWDRMKNGVGGLVSIHRVDDVVSDDVPAHVERIRADLAHGDVIAAVAVWAQLPPEAKARSDAAAWGALAKAHADVAGIANAIAGDAIAVLGTKKS